ncbi:hypothetical protein KFU94_39085 [Chloroflexi bacterium TSY]|nr:hypothetical protein [Chloroflexi bacterium TSY]
MDELITRTYPLEEVNEAFEDMLKRSCVLVRLFKTHPYNELDLELGKYVREIWGGIPKDPQMKCLTLRRTRKTTGYCCLNISCSNNRGGNIKCETDARSGLKLGYQTMLAQPGSFVD